MFALYAEVSFDQFGKELHFNQFQKQVKEDLRLEMQASWENSATRLV